MRTVAFILSLLTFGLGYSQVDTVNMYINTGYTKTIDGKLVFAKCFNPTDSFDFDAQVFRIKPGLVHLRIHNTDTITHFLRVGEIAKTEKINPNSIGGITMGIYEPGATYLASLEKDQLYLGLNAMLVAEESRVGHFFWNLKEFQTTFNSAIEQGNSIGFDDYKPNYFLINGKSFPELESDTLAKIRGAVGDTLTLFVHNTGNSVHSIHFHGYHFKILKSSRTTHVVGWEKDTYPIHKGELVVLQFVPDKPGEYPIHDHNLVAITANNIYPNGMFTTMVITE